MEPITPVTDANTFDPSLVYGALVAHAKSRSEQDYEIGVWILAADRLKLHVSFSQTFPEFIGRIFGWNGRTVLARLDTARKLETLPLLRDALRAGTMSWSHAREIARIAEPETEAVWIEKMAGKTLREVEEEVAYHEPHAKPGDPKDPRKRKFVFREEMKGEEFGELTAAIDRVVGKNPGMTSIDALLSLVRVAVKADEHVCATGDGDAAAGTRPPETIGYTLCSGCMSGWAHAPAGNFEITPEKRERLECDARVVPDCGSHGGPGRATWTIPPKTRRECVRRAGGRCETPGCTARHTFEVHHIRLVSEGGTHDLTNLVYLCAFHHARFHDGAILIEGTREAGLRFRYADGRVYGLKADPLASEVCAEVHRVLMKQGWRDVDAREILSEVRGKFVGEGLTLTRDEVLHAAQALSADRWLARRNNRRYKLQKRKSEEMVRESSPEYRADRGSAHVGRNRPLAN